LLLGCLEKLLTSSRLWVCLAGLFLPAVARFKAKLYVVEIAQPDHLIAQVAVSPQTEKEAREREDYQGASRMGRNLTLLRRLN
jgi:hypothetical protein